jgi:hypothetical protein
MRLKRCSGRGGVGDAALATAAEAAGNGGSAFALQVL